MKRNHNPEAVAHIAATLLVGKSDAEAHHVRAAVATAKSILDEAHADDEPEAAAPSVVEEKSPAPVIPARLP